MDFSLIPEAYAQSGLVATIEGYDLLILTKQAIAWAFIAAGILCLVFIFMGGISFIISSGNDEKIKKAVATIRYAVIGLIIVLISMTAVSLVSRFFNVQFTFISFTDIVETVKSITSEIGGDRTPTPGLDNDYYFEGGL
jgi:uncharacterized protein YacL